MRAPSKTALQVECAACGLFVYWIEVEGLEMGIEIKNATRAEAVRALLDGRHVFTRHTVMDHSWFSWESPSILARQFMGGKTPPKELHIAHPHRIVPGRVARKPIREEDTEGIPF